MVQLVCKVTHSCAFVAHPKWLRSCDPELSAFSVNTAVVCHTVKVATASSFLKKAQRGREKVLSVCPSVLRGAVKNSGNRFSHRGLL